MELPRRRTTSYENRSAVGNVLAPVSGLQGSAEVRTTPSTRGAEALTASRPPWATEIDAADAQQSQPRQQHAPSGPSPSTARVQRASGRDDRDSHGFSFQTPAPVDPAFRTSSPRRPEALDGSISWDTASGTWTSSTPAMTRQQSDGRARPPVDQPDVWGQQLHSHRHTSQEARGNESLYARVEHVEAAATAAPGRRGTAVPTVPPPRRSSGSCDGPHPQPGDLSSSDGASTAAARSGAASGRAARVGASPARIAPSAASNGHTNVRCTSTPKPRPAVPPKRSTSITDNFRRDWVDVGAAADRKAGGGGRISRDGGGGWREADAGGDDDRGSWLFAGDVEHSRNSNHDAQSRDPDPGSRSTASDRRRLPVEQKASAGHAGAEGHGGNDGYIDGSTSSPGGPERRPAATVRSRHPRSPPHAAADLEVTLSPPAVAPAAALVSGSGSTGGMSLGHGPSAGLRADGGSGAAAGRSSGRQGTSSASQADSARQVQVLQEENARLRDQVQHLERLLAAATPSAAVATAAVAEAGRVRKAPATGRPSSAGFTDASSPSIAAAAAGGVVLQQYKAQVIQLQRQVALMSQEIENKARLSFEVEGTLLEVATRLEDLAAGSSGCGGGRVAAAPGGDAASSLPGAAAEAAATGYGAGEGLSREQLVQLHKWSKQVLGRLRSEKSESSKLFTQQAYDSRGPRGGGLLGGHGAASWSDRSAGAAAADGAGFSPTWVVPFLPAGGNRFLLAGGGGARGDTAADDVAGAAGGGGGLGGTSMVAIAGGQAALLADPLLAHRLELQLAAVAPKLATLSVLLKIQLLPAMPWLGLEAADRLQAEVGEAAESVSQSVEALVQLCSLLPAGAAVFGEGPLAQEPKRRAAEVEAGRDSWLYSSPELLDAPEPPSPAVSDDGVISVPRLQAAIAPLLRDRKTGNKALADILEPARVKSQSAASKRAVLEAELRFAARASALHAEHVSHLMLSVGMALEDCRGAKDAAAIKSYFNAAAAVRQVMEGVHALEIHPCETCLKALVDVIRVHQDTLGRVPELLLNAPAADVEGRLLSKVEELHQGFKKAISRLEAHKRRQLDAMAGGSGGGGGGAARQEDPGSDYDNDFEALDGEESGRATVAAGSAPPPRRPPSTSSSRSSSLSAKQQEQQQQQAAMAAKSGKPPKPRPEWQG